MTIDLQNVTKIYGTQKAVDDISFELNKGEIVGFLGPNGAGKSTTMKMITGYIPPTCGKIHVLGANVEDEPLEIKAKVGYLPESNPLYYDMYVREYLDFIRNLEKDFNIAASRVDEVIEQTGLTKEIHKQIGQLSKGYKQRVGLARAILSDPEVLIMDEPTSGLDPNQILEIRELIKNLGKEKTVLLSTHIMQEVKAICQRVLIINNGKLIANTDIENLDSGSSEEVYKVAFDKSIRDFDLAKEWDLVVEVLNDKEVKIFGDEGQDIPAIVQKWATDNQIYVQQWLKESADLEYIFRKLTN